MKIRYFLIIPAILIGAVCLAINCSRPADAAKCDEPPFISTGVQSNVLFVLDSSGSMGRFAYQGSSGTVRITTDPTNSFSGDFYPLVQGWDYGSWSTDGTDADSGCMPLPCESKTTQSSCAACNEDTEGDQAWCRYWFPWSLGPVATPAGTGKCRFSRRCVWSYGNCVTQVSTTGRCRIDTGEDNYTFSYACDEPDQSTPVLQGDFTAPFDVVPRTGRRSGNNQPCTLPCSSCSNRTECRKGRWCRDWYPWQLGSDGDSGECRFSHYCSWSGGQCIETNFGYGRCEERTASGKYSFSYNCNESTQTCRVTLTPRFPTYDFTNTKCTVSLTPKASTITKNAYYTFDHGKEYYGYFNPNKLYKYDNTKHYFYTEDGPEWNVVDPDPTDGVIMRVACTSGACDKFSGNWLNWLTMRRLDVAIKVLTGGRLGGDESDYVLIGSEPFDINRIKMFNDNGSSGGYYTPFKTGVAIDFSMWDLKQRTGDKGMFAPLMVFYQVTFNSSGNWAQSVTDAMGLPKVLTHSANPGEPKVEGGITVRESSNSYYFAVKHGEVDTDDAPAGVAQKMASKVRLGYMNFNYGSGPADGYRLGTGGRVVDINGDGTVDARYYYADGGRIINRVGDTRTQDSWQKKGGIAVPIMQVVHNINETRYAMNTPIAEVMREAMEYFKQNPSCYGWADENHVVHNNFETDKGGSCPVLGPNDAPSWDPYCQPGLGRDPCAKSYVVLLSDGEPNNDNPQNCGCKTYNSSSCSRNNSGDVNRSFRFDGSGYIDDIAFIMHTEDMRPDIGSASQPPTKQTVDFYGIFAFGSGSGRLQDAAVAGGFIDLNNDGEPGSPSTKSNWRDTYWVTGYDGYYEWDSNGLSDNERVPDHFFEAEDGYLLETYLESIFSKIATGGAAGAVATISQETSDGDVIVRGAFDTVDPQNRSKFIWRGRFEAYWPDENGKYEFDDPTNSGVFCGNISSAKCDGKPCCWDVAENMKDNPAGPGEIFTMIGGTKTPFEISNVASLRPFMLDNTGAVPSEAEAQAIIQWVRGEVLADGQPTVDGTNAISGVSPFRDREGFRLGDIVYSTPVVVGPPSLAAVSRRDPDVAAFWAFRNANVHRAKIAYVGGNDGMLHAFLVARWNDGGVAGDTEKRWDYQCQAADGYPDCGEQIWAYIPTNFLGELKELGKQDYGYSSGCKHRTLVDLGPKAWDVFIASPDCPTDPALTPDPPQGCTTSRCWRTILIGGERGGGDVYFSMDVSDPLNPKVLWEYSVLKNLPVVHTVGSEEQMVLPFQNNYNRLRIVPMTWSEPALGRIQFPTDVKFPNLSGNPSTFSYIEFPDTSSDGTSTPCDSRRHVAFIGGGFRIFDPPDTSTAIQNTGGFPSPDDQTIRRALQRPNLFAMDVETGVNLFQVFWPLVVKTRDLGGELPDERIPASGASNYMPWALADPVLLDLWNNKRDVFGEDGYVDRMYIGDFRGRLFRIGFNFRENSDPNALNGLRLDYWLTKPIRSVWTDPSSCNEENMFRGCRQPITVPPAVSYDRGAAYSSNPTLRVMFGTGKFDDITGNLDDKTDPAKMAFYNKSDTVKYERVDGSVTVKEGVPLINPDGSNEVTLVEADPDKVTLAASGADWKKGFSIAGTNLGIVYNDNTECDDNYSHFQCTETVQDYSVGSETFQTASRSGCCDWWKLGSDKDDPTDDNADCCRNSGCPRCWDCIYDFAGEGERVLGKATVRGGLVFFSTYSPTQEQCSSGGQGWLYILSYDCKPFPDGFNPVTAAFGRTVIHLHAENNTSHQFGAKVDLGMAMPSRPVLDTQGENVLVQSSDSSLIRIGVDTSLIRPVQFKGWEEQ
jgi:Tfp pilus tip-associated adhesin PilY1